jgi:hypothetical protein
LYDVYVEVVMKTVMKTYPVKYPRTFDWYDGRWGELAEWCDSAFGDKNWAWSHISEEFLFEKASDRMLFVLRWL